MSGSPSDQSRQVTTLLRSIAAHGLESSRLELPARIETGWIWDRLLAETRSKRLSGHLADVVGAATTELTAPQVEAVIEQHARVMATDLHLEQMLLEVIDAFDRDRIDHRVLKGCASAHLDYPDPALRCFGDVDLLVRSADFDTAARSLTDAGFRRRYPEPRPGFDRRFSKGAAFVSPTGLELDLHRTLALGPFGLLIELEDLWNDHHPYEIAGRPLRALGPEPRFLHACYHAALGDPAPRLVALRDIAQMLDDGHLDLAVVRRLAARWKGEAVVVRALGLATDILALGHTEVAHWVATYAPSGPERRALRIYTDPSMSYAARAMAAARVVPGLRGKAGYVGSLAFPERRYVQHRHPSRRGRWWSAARQLRDLLRR